jgi:hypothetical protein
LTTGLEDGMDSVKDVGAGFGITERVMVWAAFVGCWDWWVLVDVLLVDGNRSEKPERPPGRNPAAS